MEDIVKFNQEAFNKYENLKRNFPRIILGFEARYLLLKEFVYYCYERDRLQKFNLKSFIQSIYVCYDMSEIIPYIENEHTIFTQLQDRVDHKEFITSIIKQTKEGAIFKNFGFKKKTLSKFNLKIGWLNLRLFLNIWKLKNLSRKEKLNFIVILTQKIHTLNFLNNLVDKNKIKLNKFIAFNAPYNFDALLTAFFKNLGVKTYSIQHGIFYEYLTFVPYDIINYEFKLTDFILCWGPQSAAVLKNRGISDKNITIAGNPKYTDLEGVIKLKQVFKNCLVLLGRFIYHEGNMQLLHLLGEISKLHNINITIKAHPSLRITNEIDYQDYQFLYKKYNFKEVEPNAKLTTVFKDEKFDFCISYNTGAYVESYVYGLICFRFSLGENDYIEGLDDRFSNEKEFTEKMKAFKEINEETLSLKAKSLVNNILSPSLLSYASILKST